MFGSKKKPCIADCLEKGRSWVRELDEAVQVTEDEAKEKNEEVSKLQTEVQELDTQITEGKTVANNFKKMLVMDKE